MPELNLKFKHHLPGEPVPSNSNYCLIIVKEYWSNNCEFRNCTCWPYQNCLKSEDFDSYDSTEEFWYAELPDLEKLKITANMLSEVPAV